MRTGSNLVVGVAVALASVQLAPGVRAQAYVNNPTSSDFVSKLGQPDADAEGTEGPLRSKGTTRGLRINPEPAAPRPAAVPTQPSSAGVAAPAPRVAAEPAQRAASPAPVQRRAPSVNFPVQFAFGSAELSPEARGVPDQLGTALRSDELKAYSFRIVGHTDAVGSDEYNRELSRRRAEAVEEYLRSRFGVEGNRLRSVGLGKSQPYDAQNPFNSINRRVEIVREGTSGG